MAGTGSDGSGDGQQHGAGSRDQTRSIYLPQGLDKRVVSLQATNMIQVSP